MNIEQTLLDLGYTLSDRGTYWQAAAIYRDGDNPTALQIYKDSGAWKDYVEDTPYLPFISLVQRTVNSDDPDILRKYTSGNFKPASRPKQLLTQEKIYPDECLKRLLPHYDFYLEKGISIPTLQKYKCGLATNGNFYQRMVFPIMDSQGGIHGFSGRSVTGKNPKWLHKGKKNNWFYPFNLLRATRESIQETQSVFLIESIGDSLSLSENDTPNHLVSFGLSLSPSFISRLLGLNVNYIGIAFNNDIASKKNNGLIGSLKSLVKLSKFFDIEKLWITPPTKNDFGDMSPIEISQWKRGLRKISHKDNMLMASKELSEIIRAPRTSEAFQKDVKTFQKKVNFYYS